MSGKDEYLVVEVHVMVNLGPDSAEAWPEERCEAEARRVVDAVNADFAVAAGPVNWWVQ